MTTVINGSSPSITFSDGTTQTTAPTYAGPSIQIFTSSGTFTVPTGITKLCVAVFGAGGGGGGSSSGGSGGNSSFGGYIIGGGGSGGAYGYPNSGIGDCDTAGGNPAGTSLNLQFQITGFQYNGNYGSGGSSGKNGSIFGNDWDILRLVISSLSFRALQIPKIKSNSITELNV